MAISQKAAILSQKESHLGRDSTVSKHEMDAHEESIEGNVVLDTVPNDVCCEEKGAGEKRDELKCCSDSNQNSCGEINLENREDIVASTSKCPQQESGLTDTSYKKAGDVDNEGSNDHISNIRAEILERMSPHIYNTNSLEDSGLKSKEVPCKIIPNIEESMGSDSWPTIHDVTNAHVQINANMTSQNYAAYDEEQPLLPHNEYGSCCDRFGCVLCYAVIGLIMCPFLGICGTWYAVKSGKEEELGNHRSAFKMRKKATLITTLGMILSISLTLGLTYLIFVKERYR